MLKDMGQQLTWRLLATASIAGLQTDAHLVGNQFNTALAGKNSPLSLRSVKLMASTYTQSHLHIIQYFMSRKLDVRSSNFSLSHLQVYSR